MARVLGYGIAVLSFFLFHAFAATAAETVQGPIETLVNQVVSQKMTYKGRGKLPGAISKQACLYTGKSIAVVKDYCYPKKKYRARKIIVISPELGIITFYRYNMDNKVEKTIRFQKLPETMGKQLASLIKSSKLSISSWNKFSAKLEAAKKTSPYCWTSNLEQGSVGRKLWCFNVEPKEYHKWRENSLYIVNDEALFESLLKRIEAHLRK